MLPKAGTRSVLRRAVSAHTRKVSSVRCVPSNQQEGPKFGTRSVLRRAVSSARIWKESSVWYVPSDQQEGPLPFHCCCGRRSRRKGAPSNENPPEKEQGCGLDGKQQNRYEKKHRRDWRNAATIASQAFRRRYLRGYRAKTQSAPCLVGDI